MVQNQKLSDYAYDLWFIAHKYLVIDGAYGPTLILD